MTDLECLYRTYYDELQRTVALYHVTLNKSHDDEDSDSYDEAQRLYGQLHILRMIEKDLKELLEDEK